MENSQTPDQAAAGALGGSSSSSSKKAAVTTTESSRLPKKQKEMVACLRCTLVKNFSQFLQDGCDNCHFFNMEGDYSRTEECTTALFSGIITCCEPTTSWAARFLKIEKLVPGCYAISVTGELPPEMQALCKKAKAIYRPRK